MAELLKKLIEATGTSGNEIQVRKIILKEIKKHIKDVKVDKFGNIVATKKGNGPKIMLAAHMDEIGLMVKTISTNGNIHVSPMGGIEPSILTGQKVKIKAKKGYIYGVCTTIEISDATELPEELPKMSDIIIDTGLDSKELKKIGVGIGSFIEFVRDIRPLGKKDIITGKAMDDRIGCYILIELAKKLKNSKAHVAYVFTVQEEIGLYGSKTAVYNINPDWAIVMDVTNADDLNEHDHEITKKVGKGPSIIIKDEEMISNPYIDQHLKKLAKQYKIPLQLDVSDAGTTDALSISFSKGGIPTAVIGVPIRNLHTAYSIASIKDIKDCIKLVEKTIKSPPKLKV